MAADDSEAAGRRAGGPAGARRSSSGSGRRSSGPSDGENSAGGRAPRPALSRGPSAGQVPRDGSRGRLSRDASGGRLSRGQVPRDASGGRLSRGPSASSVGRPAAQRPPSGGAAVGAGLRRDSSGSSSARTSTSSGADQRRSPAPPRPGSLRRTHSKPGAAAGRAATSGSDSASGNASSRASQRPASRLSAAGGDSARRPERPGSLLSVKSAGSRRALSRDASRRSVARDTSSSSSSSESDGARVSSASIGRRLRKKKSAGDVRRSSGDVRPARDSAQGRSPRHSPRDGLSSGRSSQAEDGAFWTFDPEPPDRDVARLYPIRRFDSEPQPWWAASGDDAKENATPENGDQGSEAVPTASLREDGSGEGALDLGSGAVQTNPAYVPRPCDSCANVWWEVAENNFNEAAPQHSATPPAEPEPDPRFQAFPVRRNLSEPRAWWEDAADQPASPPPPPRPASPVRFRSAREMLGLYDDDEESSAEPADEAAARPAAAAAAPAAAAQPESVSSSTETESSSSESGSSVHQEVGSEESSDEEPASAACSADRLRFSLSMLRADASDDEPGSSAAPAGAAAGAAVLASDFVFRPGQRDSGYGTADRGSPPHVSFIGACQDIDTLLAGQPPAADFEEFERTAAGVERAEVAAAAAAAPDEPGLAGAAVPSDQERQAAKRNLSLFISQMTNIDEVLGVTSPEAAAHRRAVSAVAGRGRPDKKSSSADTGSSDSADGSTDSDSQAADVVEVDPSAVTIHERTNRDDGSSRKPAAGTETESRQLSDTTMQLYKDGELGSYLDLEASINEQHEEFEGFTDNPKNALVVRTQLSIRCHAIIEKLLNSQDRDLRRALFSLKQIFQDDKDLVHEFVNNDGLACLIKVGLEADQKYQNYILRALGQVMLYVDGMNGVMEHGETIQWLYSLLDSQYRLVVKTALKLLLVFVEYTEPNGLLLVQAINTVDKERGRRPWYGLMALLRSGDSADAELLVFAATLINKALNAVDDQTVYYDQTDCLEELGMEAVANKYLSRAGTEPELVQQLQIYEAVLKREDGESDGSSMPVDANIRTLPRSRRSPPADPDERRRSRRFSARRPSLDSPSSPEELEPSFSFYRPAADSWSVSERRRVFSRDAPAAGVEINGLSVSQQEPVKYSEMGVTPGLRRRRERQERQRSFIREQEQRSSLSPEKEDEWRTDEENKKNAQLSRLEIPPPAPLSRDPSSHGIQSDSQSLAPAPLSRTESGILKKPWVLGMMYQKSAEEPLTEPAADDLAERRRLDLDLKPDSVRDLRQKLLSQPSPLSPGDERPGRIGDSSGIISKAKEELSRSKSKHDLKSPEAVRQAPEAPKKSENDLHWEQLIRSLERPLLLADLDFSDLNERDDADVVVLSLSINGVPPPPPPPPGGVPPPPPPGVPPPPPRLPGMPPPPPPPAPIGRQTALGVESCGQSSFYRNRTNGTAPARPLKTKKTVKLFWREVRDDFLPANQTTIWDEIPEVGVDTQKLEHLFESRAKDLIVKEKQQEAKGTKEIVVLDHKRSNAINICMTKLPPPRTIKTAILKMDATIINKEGIEKLLSLLPSDEEISRISEAQVSNPELPLGSAENFLLTLGSISEIAARLKLWVFKLDYDNMEKEVAEPLMDLKQGVELLSKNKTFKSILTILRSIGNFLNGSEAKGFYVDYLAKVPEVKDTVHKHSLLHHLCHMVMEKYPDSSDLYSEVGAVTRASRIDFDELEATIRRMETECKASWDHLKVIAKHDGQTPMRQKMSEFLADSAERIIVLGIIHRRVMNRFYKFLSWLGVPPHQLREASPRHFCKVVSEFALEYRTTRERVLQQMEKKANHRERNKTRGKMITDSGQPYDPAGRQSGRARPRQYRTKEEKADDDLKQILGTSDVSDTDTIRGTMPWRRKRESRGGQVDSLPDGDDEILESLVKSATRAPSARSGPRERRRTSRNADRKSLKRSRTREDSAIAEE